jgi:hypothetical protein
LKILVHSDLEPGRLRAQYDKVVGMLARDDFYSAEVKKLPDRDRYRAKLDYLFPACALRGSGSPATKSLSIE